MRKVIPVQSHNAKVLLWCLPQGGMGIKARRDETEDACRPDRMRVMRRAVQGEENLCAFLFCEMSMECMERAQSARQAG